jgi:GYF domain 2
METQKLYFRNPTESEARGPFSLQQITDLAEAGQITRDSLFYNPDSDQWTALGTYPELFALVFPEKKKLTLKSKEITKLNKPDSRDKVIEVTDLLDSAEGRTEETKSRANPEIAMMRAVRIGMIAAPIALVAAAAAEIIPSGQTLASINLTNLTNLTDHPLVLLGLADVVLAFFLALGVSAIYPILRFRATFGLGLVGLILHAQGMPLPGFAALIGSAGIYFCTLAVSLVPAITAAAAGVGGMGLLAFLLINA